MKYILEPLFYIIRAILISIIATIYYLLMIIFYCLIWKFRLPNKEDFKYEDQDLFGSINYYESIYHYIWNIK